MTSPTEKIKTNFLKFLDKAKNDFYILRDMQADNTKSSEEFDKASNAFSDSLKNLTSLQKVLNSKNITFLPEEIATFGYDPLQKANEIITTPFPERKVDIFRLNYNYDVTFINLRDIRFSQTSISLPFDNELEVGLQEVMNNYPCKFYNYGENNLVLLGMFGENDYTQTTKVESSYNPTIPSLNVVKINENNCYVSIDNRRIELIYRQLCLFLSINPNLCSISSMVFKNTNDFLRYELGIPNSVEIYIPCSVKDDISKPPRQMKTPEGIEKEKMNKALGLEDSSEPRYSGVIWERVTNPRLDKYRDYPLNGLQMFPATPIKTGKNEFIRTNEQLNEKANIIIYKNKYSCRTNSDVIKGPINIKQIIDELVKQNLVKQPYQEHITELNYKNLQQIYYYIANIFINYLKTSSTNFVEIINSEQLFDNTLKFLPDFDSWKTNIDKIPLYSENTTGGGETKKRKRRKNGTRKKPKTKKCVKNKTLKNSKQFHVPKVVSKYRKFLKFKPPIKK
jgi:hypothetical protein